MRIWLVSSWGNACGIAEHAAYLKAAIEAADLDIQIRVDTAWLDPAACARDASGGREPDWLMLNWHRGLHSRWTAELVRGWRRSGVKVAVIFHDTHGEHPPDALTTALHDAADLFVVHEPCEGLPRAKVWRQGIPAAEMPTYFGLRTEASLHPSRFKAYDRQPVIGSIGFGFGWKNFDRLAEATAEAGCALLLLAPNATPEQVAGWQAANPWSYIRTDFVDRREAVSLLSGCDATAYLYECGNTGTSGAIRMGIAARRPVVALRGCRQFRDLRTSACAGVIHWTDAVTVRETAWALAEALDTPQIGSLTYLAEQDSWIRLGRKYAAALRGDAQ